MSSRSLVVLRNFATCENFASCPFAVLTPFSTLFCGFYQNALNIIVNLSYIYVNSLTLSTI